MTTIKEALLEASEALKAGGVETPRLDAEVLLSHTLGLAREDILFFWDKPLESKEKKEFLAAVSRREKREPVALITGVKEFWSLPFKVNEDTLIPSPDSETLVEAALVWAKAKPGLRILDLGTGSGCLLLAILSELADARGVGVDVSENALACAIENAKQLGLSGRVSFQVFDWMKDKPLEEEKFDLVISNPPYVALADKQTLEPEVATFGPEKALYGGNTGFTHIEKILERLNEFLRPGGKLLMEVGEGQSGPVKDMFEASNLVDIKTHKDLAGIERVVSGRLP